MSGKGFEVLVPIYKIAKKKLAPDTPSTNNVAGEQLEAGKKNLSKTRAKIFATQGQELGQELATGQVQNTRGNIFGN